MVADLLPWALERDSHSAMWVEEESRNKKEGPLFRGGLPYVLLG
jgi:hypothetical protein